MNDDELNESQEQEEAPKREPTVPMVKDGNTLDVAVSDIESHRRMGWKLAGA